jgi:hypothetical protein
VYKRLDNNPHNLPEGSSLDVRSVDNAAAYIFNTTDEDIFGLNYQHGDSADFGTK